MDKRLEVVEFYYTTAKEYGWCAIDPLEAKMEIYWNAGEVWNKVPFTIGTMDYKEQRSTPQSGAEWNRKFTASLPGKASNNQNYINGLCNERVLVKLVLQDGTVLLVGHHQCLVKFEYSVDNSSNSITFSFSQKSNFPTFDPM